MRSDYKKEKDSYRGLSARLYDLWLPEDLKDEEFIFIRQVLQQRRGTSLEVGCGTGRLLVPLVREGFRVEGVDASPDMLAICRRKLAAEQLDSRLQCGWLPNLSLPQTYDTIFASMGTMQLLPGGPDLVNALASLRLILAPGGLLVFGIFTIDRQLSDGVAGGWHIRREAVRPTDGAIARCFERVRFDANSTRISELRYEVRTNTGHLLETAEEQIALYCPDPTEFVSALCASGYSSAKLVTAYDGGDAAQLGGQFLLYGTT